MFRHAALRAGGLVPPLLGQKKPLGPGIERKPLPPLVTETVVARLRGYAGFVVAQQPQPRHMHREGGAGEKRLAHQLALAVRRIGQVQRPVEIGQQGRFRRQVRGESCLGGVDQVVEGVLISLRSPRMGSVRPAGFQIGHGCRPFNKGTARSTRIFRCCGRSNFPPDTGNSIQRRVKCARLSLHRSMSTFRSMDLTPPREKPPAQASSSASQ